MAITDIQEEGEEVTIHYPEGFTINQMRHIVHLMQLEENDIIPAGTLILPFWTLRGNC